MIPTKGIFLIELLDNKINLVIVLLILILAFLDVILKKDLKSQIVSLGVLGTFLGIFIGLQDFNPEDMKNSINNILLGLKTAFFTSIVGMGTALLLAIIQKVFYKKMDNSSRQENILLEILNKLNHLGKLDKIQDTDKIVAELERLRTVQTDTRDESIKIYKSIDALRENSNKENEKLIDILGLNFAKMNNSLEIAIDKLSKGATEEIIKALEQVIQEFNQELQSSFGDNFVQLNEAVINLLAWQNNYKTHIEKIENTLSISSASLEKSKESFELIASGNTDVLKVYKALKEIIFTYNRQVQDLNKHLKTYAHLSSSAEEMFLSITNNIEKTKDDFSRLTAHIKDENQQQSHLNRNMMEEMRSHFDKNQKQLALISTHFKSLGEHIPKALEVSLNELNRGLTSLTSQFQKDYKEIMDHYKSGLN